MKAKTIMWSLLALIVSVSAAGQQRRHTPKEPFVTDTPMVHDPVIPIISLPRAWVSSR